MSDTQLVDADPIVTSPTPEEKSFEMREHVGTYNAFVHLVLWFCLHVPLLLLGLYAMTLGGSMAGGAVLVVAAIAILVYGLVTTFTRSPEI